MKHVPVPTSIFHNNVANSGHKLSKPSTEAPQPPQHPPFTWRFPELQPLLPSNDTVERSTEFINHVGCSMSSYLAKMPTLARQATSFVANLFTGASPSTKVG
ncbi:unnamed protein product [Bursaphelenchus xylophilus]|uniref:(pine wood nematode) hypothetical protein n=1 Tax=Bursaphelenchus xylophilus TaxID=6326 RepID=A0A811K4E9_BURXY|nr:unnamed protein product [Bursaphelenchus xylophilus]CAG9087103.1 unnamed protein product [Bursaphelenchus xylophilus]